jgi:uncharacterized protein YcbK (DUF882 family)
MGDLTKNFSRHEFACRCCGVAGVRQSFVERLQLLRNLIGKPIIVTSGYRCPDHNERIGGAKNSFHTQGIAADVKADIDLKEFFVAAEKVGFEGIGYYPEEKFLHVDIGNRTQRWRREKGRYFYLL